MMRGSKAVAVAVRAPSGDIVVRMEPLKAGIYTKPWGKWPLVRGLAMLWDALVLGMRALTFSANVALEEEGEGVEFSGPVAWGTIAVSLAAGIALFFLLPSAIAKLLDHLIPSDLLSSLVEGIVRVGIFIGYIAAIGQWKDIQRVFAYHGAEHKTINAYEAGVPWSRRPSSGTARATPAVGPASCWWCWCCRCWFSPRSASPNGTGACCRGWC
jgi:uncharacterized protein YqhQ